MSGERKLLIISGSVLSFLFLIKLVEELPSMFSTFQQQLLLGSGVSVVLIIILKTLLS